jgi:hypothetical protein
MAQNRSGFVTPGPIVRTFGSVVQPGGTSGMPGIQRTTGSVIFPGGSQQIGIPGIPPVQPNFSSQRWGAAYPNGMNHSDHSGRRGGAIYAYPVYVPSYYDSSYYTGGTVAPLVQPQQPQQPNVTVVYPQQQGTPVIINLGSPDNAYTVSGNPPPQSLYQPQPPPPHPRETVETPAESEHYLLAFKDHSIYSAVAYWVDGDTVHYFTAGNTHNQASLSLIDRELTERLNRESGHEVKLPAAK